MSVFFQTFFRQEPKLPGFRHNKGICPEVGQLKIEELKYNPCRYSEWCIKGPIPYEDIHLLTSEANDLQHDNRQRVGSGVIRE